MDARNGIDWSKGGGLVPAIVQHAVTGRVLMLGYMNAESLALTRQLGLITFYSRSRQRLWTKGETSGHTLELRHIELDCDKDTLLVSAIPGGPTCHLERNSCFDENTERGGDGFIGELETIIDDRIRNKSADSYTRQLVDLGIQQIAKKVGEEGVEVALAGICGSRDEIVGEAADLVFHLLVLLRHHNLSFADVTKQLYGRHTQSRQLGVTVET
jgi:phosphoribosyl-ATP pyrophosphohydrolase/phosphoribosyl-AMP cyclohydrolase